MAVLKSRKSTNKTKSWIKRFTLKHNFHYFRDITKKNTFASGSQISHLVDVYRM